MTTSVASALQRGIVKSVQSGDSIIVRGQPKGGPPPEKQINLAYLIAPKISRKMPDNTYTVDEPYAWRAREYLRKKLVGKEISFRIEYKLPFGGSQRECAIIYCNNENINELLVSEGLVDVVKRAQNKDNPDVIRMIEIEELAKGNGLGKWSGSSAATVGRQLLQEIENGQALVGKSYEAIVEHVRDGSTLRVGLFVGSVADGSLQQYQMVTLQLSGVRCPQMSEAFGEEARFFTETRLLQRDVQVRIQQYNAPSSGSTQSSSGTFSGSISFLERDIAEYLLKDGYARVVDWTLALTADPKKLRSFEREAKTKRLRLWRDWKDASGATGTAVSGAGSVSSKTGFGSNFDAKVLEVINADALVVQTLETKEIKKIFFSSIRAPRADSRAMAVTAIGAGAVGENGETPVVPAPAPTPAVNTAGGGDRKQFRPLYDIPFMFEAREFLRKRLIGKMIKVHVDYIQPKTDNFPEKVCTTVTGADGQNVAEQLIIKGLVTVVKYRADHDDQRSVDYDSYLAAEMKAQKTLKGLYSNKPDAGLVRIVDLSADLNKSKSFAPFLTRSTGLRKDAVVEYIFPSSTKVKLYIPKENCLINLVLGGVNAATTSKSAGDANAAAAAEAVQWAKHRVYQRDIHVEIETQDKVGNYIGSIYYDKNHNLAIELLRNGLLSLREYCTKNDYIQAEAEAKSARKGIWKDWQPEESVEPSNGGDYDATADGAVDGTEGATSSTDGAASSNTSSSANSTPAATGIVDDLAKRIKVVITNVSSTFSSFHAQEVAEGPKIEALLTRLREEATANPPLPGYRPKKGDLAMARFSEDGQWYRAKIEKPINANESQVLYIDYGNREVLPNSAIASLPPGFSQQPPGAREYAFAFVFPDTDLDFLEETRHEFVVLTADKVVLLKVEYRDPAGPVQDAATVVDEKTKKDIVLGMVKDGWLFVDTKARRTGRLFKKFNEYKDTQEEAKKNGINLWQYGDVTPDDAKEFGYPARA